MSYFFQHGSGKIHYTDRGHGSVVILIHGYLETSEIWGSFAIRLAERLRVIAVDLPGHGKSDIFDTVHTMEFMAALITALMDHLNIEKGFITGHSMGGYVTLALADLFPSRLSGFCLFHSHPFADTPETVIKRKGEIDLVKKGKKDLFFPVSVNKMYATENLNRFHEKVLHSKEVASSIPAKGIIAVLKGMIKRPERLNVVESGKVPSLWLLGGRDNYIDSEAILKRVQIPENAKVIILKHSGHMGFIEEEDLSLKVIAEFINNLEGSR